MDSSISPSSTQPASAWMEVQGMGPIPQVGRPMLKPTGTHRGQTLVAMVNSSPSRQTGMAYPGEVERICLLRRLSRQQIHPHRHHPPQVRPRHHQGRLRLRLRVPGLPLRAALRVQASRVPHRQVRVRQHHHQAVAVLHGRPVQALHLRPRGRRLRVRARALVKARPRRRR